MDAPTDTETENSEGCEDDNCLKPNGVFYKTQLCFKFMQGNCRFRSCRFAHGMAELRHPDKDKDTEPANATSGILQRIGGYSCKRRRICYQWEANGTCSFGDNCRYPHEHQKYEEEGPMDFKNGDLYDWEKASKPRGCITQTLNERAISQIFRAESVDLPIHFAVNDDNPVNKVIVTPAEKSAENINKEKNDAIEVLGCQKNLSRWKGPQKITRIYGDWIDE